MPEAVYNFIKIETCRRCFPVSFAKFLRTPFLYRAPLVAASSASEDYLSEKEETWSLFYFLDFFCAS